MKLKRGAAARGCVVQGWDISLRHGAVVTLEDGKLVDMRYATYNQKSASFGKDKATRIVPPFDTKDKTSGRDPDTEGVWRQEFWRGWINDRLEEVSPDYAGIEGYAMGNAQGAHQIGEVGGQVRLAFFSRRIPYRVWDPKTVKMFSAGNGAADKDDVKIAVLSEWGVYLEPFDAGSKASDTSGDLADAFVIAMMVWFEVRIRAAQLDLASLPEKRRHVFLRTTNFRPVNVLATDWVGAY